MGCEPMPTAAIAPQHNAVCERHGGIWKTHARRLPEIFSVKFVTEQLHRVTWLTAAVTWACNSAIDDSGYSPVRWVLGRGLRLPYTLLDQTGRLSLHERVTRDRAFSERDDVSCTEIDHFAAIWSSIVKSSACQIASTRCRPSSTAFPGRRRCVRLERQRKGKA